MTWVDWAVIGVMAVSGLLAYSRGFVKEVLGIAAWIGALVFASQGQEFGRAFAMQWIKDPQIASAVSFVTLLLVSLVVLKFVASAISKAVKGSVLGGIDRVFGLLFGFGRGLLLAIIAYILGGMVTSIDHWPEEVKAARCLPVLYDGATWARAVLLPLEYRPRLYQPPSDRELTSRAMMRTSPLGRAIPGK
jgi:membrane protein required for colicin V production